RIDIPPLRRRRNDIPMLIARFLDEAAAELGREVVLSHGAASAAIEHPWPGNVRALRNAVMRAAALSDGPISATELLPPDEPPRPTGNTITIPRGTWSNMHAALLQQVVTDEGSIRRAAQALDVPRSTLSAWLRKLEGDAR